MHQRPTRPKSAKGRVRSNRYRQSSAKPSAFVVSTSSSNEDQLHNPSNVLSQVPDHPIPSNNSDQSTIIQQEQQERFPTVPRPVSSLSKYRILPSISAGTSSIQLQQQFADPDIDLNAEPFIPTLMKNPEMEPFLARMKNPEVEPFLARLKNPEAEPSLARLKNPEAEPVTSARMKYPESEPVYSKASYGAPELSESMKELRVDAGYELPPALLIALRLPDADGTRVNKLFPSTSTPKDLLNFAYECNRAAVKSPNLCCLFFTNLEGKKEQITNVDKSLQQLGIADRSLLYVEWNCYEE